MAHGGEASGFISQNTTLPEDHVSVTVLTNGQGRAAPSIARQIENLLLAPAVDPEAAPRSIMPNSFSPACRKAS